MNYLIDFLHKTPKVSQVNIDGIAAVEAKYNFTFPASLREWFATENPMLQAEQEVCFNIKEDVDFVGHVDFINEDFIYELKSVTSKNTYRDVFRKEKPKAQNILQLATYMVALERDKGKLIYGSFIDTITYDQFKELGDDDFEEMCETLKPDDTIEFLITIDEDGEFLSNGERTDIKVQDICAFWEAAADMLIDEDVPAVPQAVADIHFLSRRSRHAHHGEECEQQTKYYHHM